jgi:hypothetical protein
MKYALYNAILKNGIESIYRGSVRFVGKTFSLRCPEWVWYQNVKWVLWALSPE